MKSIALSIMLGVVSYGNTYKCTELFSTTTLEALPVVSTVSISESKASVSIDGIGKFHYKYTARTPMIIYGGVDNGGYLAYSKLNPEMMLLSGSTAISGCVKQGGKQ